IAVAGNEEAGSLGDRAFAARAATAVEVATLAPELAEEALQRMVIRKVLETRKPERIAGAAACRSDPRRDTNADHGGRNLFHNVGKATHRGRLDPHGPSHFAEALGRRKYGVGIGGNAETGGRQDRKRSDSGHQPAPQA